jgi:hypothetical protein
MIDKTLTFLLDELNGFLGGRFQSSENLVVLSGLVNPDGTVPMAIENKLILTLVNAEREAAAVSAGANSSGFAGPRTRVSPPLNLNLYVLVSANFGNNYAEAIKFLSQALAFFQAKPVFTPQGSAAFPGELERLSMELVNLDFSLLNNLWAALGAKYLPSVVYKVRMLSIQEAWVTDRVPGITGTDTGR